MASLACSSGSFLFINGVSSPGYEVPTVTSFLETYSGAYTTTRTFKSGTQILFWTRHLRRLAQSAMILCNSIPEIFCNHKISEILKSPSSSLWERTIWYLVHDSMAQAMPKALNSRGNNEELAITALVSGNPEKLSENRNVVEGNFGSALSVYLYISPYTPSAFGVPLNAGHLAVAGFGRDMPMAKYSKWARTRKALEKLRPPNVTELLLSSDGDKILEGCLTNFFVVCHISCNDPDRGLPPYCESCSFEVQTTPFEDGVLPGIIRQKIIEACMSLGIPLREVAPSWSKREFWKEAFITSSLRLVQHVESIRVPQPWESLTSRTWKEVMWEEKKFKEGAGQITRIIQKAIEVEAEIEGFRVSDLIE